MRLLLLVSALGAIYARKKVTRTTDLDPNEPACSGQNPRSTDVDTSILENGSTKTVTNYVCPDGSLETRTDITSTETNLKINFVRLSDYKIHMDLDTFLLHNAVDNRKIPEGWTTVDIGMISQGLWGYFAYYYSVWGGVHSFGWNVNSHIVCLAKSRQLKLTHGHFKSGESCVSDQLLNNDNAQGEYKFCASKPLNADGSQTCWDADDAVAFRDTESLVVGKNNGCRKGLLLLVKISFINDNEIKWKGSPEEEPEDGNTFINPDGDGKGEGRECGGHTGVSCKDNLKPINVLIGGKKVRMGSAEFILGEHEKKSRKYVIVTPKMLNNGFWVLFKRWYSKFRGLKTFGTYTSESVCLGEGGYKLHSFADVEAQIDLAVSEIETTNQLFSTEGPGNGKYQLCQNDVCFENPADFKNSVEFAVNKGVCNMSMNLYVTRAVYLAVTATWDETVIHEVVVIKTEEEDCDPATDEDCVAECDPESEEGCPEVDPNAECCEGMPEAKDQMRSDIEALAGKADALDEVVRALKSSLPDRFNAIVMQLNSKLPLYQESVNQVILNKEDCGPVPDGHKPLSEWLADDDTLIDIADREESIPKDIATIEGMPCTSC